MEAFFPRGNQGQRHPVHLPQDPALWQVRGMGAARPTPGRIGGHLLEVGYFLEVAGSSAELQLSSKHFLENCAPFLVLGFVPRSVVSRPAQGYPARRRKATMLGNGRGNRSMCNRRCLLFILLVALGGHPAAQAGPHPTARWTPLRLTALSPPRWPPSASRAWRWPSSRATR